MKEIADVVVPKNIMKIDGKNNNHDVFLVTISTCIWCKMLKKLLDENNIQYQYVDIDLLPKAQKNSLVRVLSNYTDRLGFPICFIDEAMIRGFKENEILNKLK
ncbi:MAG: glutaredoxin family protein [Candidatus Helarchaeota archaeon]